MKPFLFATLVVLAAAGPRATAQGMDVGVVGGIANPKGSSSDASTLGYYAESGWTGGIVLQLPARAGTFAFRFDALYSQSYGKTFVVNDPGGGTGTTATDFAILGGTGNLVWTIVGAAEPTKLYAIGGLGIYALQTHQTWSNPTAGTTSTDSGLGYDAGLGVRISNFFIEARYTVIKPRADLSGMGTSSITSLP